MSAKMSPSKASATKASPVLDVDAWVKDAVADKGCNTCAHKAASETINQLLKAMIRNRAYAVPLREIHKKLKEVHPDYTVGFWGFRAHMYECVRKLYKRARGKDHA